MDKPHQECPSEVKGFHPIAPSTRVSPLGLGEVLAIRWRDCHLPASGTGSITVASIVVETSEGFFLLPYAKTSHSRGNVAIGPELVTELRAWRREQAARRLKLGIAWEDNDLVVCGAHGQLLRPSKVSEYFAAAIQMLEDCGELRTGGASFHTFRHTHATLLLRARVPVHVVSKRLRHSRIQITLDYYAHVIPDQDASVAVDFEALMGASETCDDDTVHMDCTSDTKRAALATLS